jgi:hypothetical protein
MINRKLLLIFSIFLLVFLACNFTSGTLPNGNQPSSVGRGSFSAEATSPVSVYLTWPAVNGVEKYLIDVRVGQEDFIPLAELTADQTSFEDFPVPQETELTYRLRTVTGSETGAGETVTVATPLATPNPITVKAKVYQPVIWAPPTVDPNNPNLDPSDYYPPGFDPNNPEAFDPSSVMTIPSASEIIGPEGGTITVTSPDGVTYSLNVPAGAVEGSIVITLTPIQSIEGLPQNGSLLGAVKIEPEGFALDVPAILILSMPEGTPAITKGMYAVGFAYKGDGSEFHLVPKGVSSEVLSANPIAGVKLASMSQGTNHQAPGETAINIGDRLINIGIARWPQEIVDIAKTNSPSDPGDQSSLEMAVIQVKEEVPDELAPLDLNTPKPDPQVIERAQSTLEKANAADSWPKFNEVLQNFQEYLAAGNDLPGLNKINTKIWDKLVESAKSLLDKNKGTCFSADDTAAQEVAEKLWGPKGQFSEMLALKFKLKYGQSYIDQLGENLKKCKVYLKIVSSISYDQDGVTTSAAVLTTIPLKWKFDRSARTSFLSGSGNLEYTLFDVNAPGCSNFKLNTLAGSTFTITRLSPVYAAGVLQDFGMAEYSVGGKQSKINAQCVNGKVSGGALNGAQGDIWGGLFVMSHAPDQMVVNQWAMHSTKGNPVGIVAEKEYRWNKSATLGSGNVDEFTTFTLIVGKK